MGPDWIRPFFIGAPGTLLLINRPEPIEALAYLGVFLLLVVLLPAAQALGKKISNLIGRLPPTGPRGERQFRASGHQQAGRDTPLRKRSRTPR